MTELCFPQLRDDHRDRGVVAKWLVEEGVDVRAGQRLAEIRGLGGGPADWVPALATGTLWHQVREGEVVTPGAVIGLIE